MQDLEKRAESFFYSFLVPPFDGATKPNPLADFLEAVRVLELIVEGLGQIIGDQPLPVGQIGAAIFRHLPTRKVAGEAIHHC